MLIRSYLEIQSSQRAMSDAEEDGPMDILLKTHRKEKKELQVKSQTNDFKD